MFSARCTRLAAPVLPGTRSPRTAGLDGLDSALHHRTVVYLLGLTLYVALRLLPWVAITALAAYPLYSKGFVALEGKDFYSVSAQVIPVLLLAWILQSRFIDRHSRFVSDVHRRASSRQRSWEKFLLTSIALLSRFGAKKAVVIVGFAELAALCGVMGDGAPWPVGTLVLAGFCIPGIALVVDILGGFPTETPADADADAGE